MPENTVVVANVNGIHCRPSSVIVREAMGFSSDLFAEGNGTRANLKSMIEIITLALHQGDAVKLIAEGEDEVAALDRMCELFVEHFDYPDK